MTIKKSYANWTTDNEIKYINSLARGTYPRENQIPADRDLLLTNYIRSAKRRLRWHTFGEVDPYAVIAHAEKLLQGEII